jgi:hypothetical protein
MNKGTRRITIETLASGQPRAYADTIHHVRVTFEDVPWIGPNEGFKPCENWKEESVRQQLKGLMCGFTEFVCPKNPTMDEHFRTRLDWLRNTAPGVWEFHTTSPYTD